MLSELDRMSAVADKLVITDSDFEKFRDFFYRKTGIKFENSKRYFVDKRLIDRITETKTSSFRQYFSFMRFQASVLSKAGMMESRMKKILIIDDALTVRMYHKQLMEQLGFKVEEAVNGLEALEKIQDFQPDVCLVDANMPKMDGYRFIKELRNDSALQHIPCIMISTEAEQHDKEKAYVAGANFYIVKPAKVDELQNISRLIAGAA